MCFGSPHQMFHSEKYGVINKSILREKEIVSATELSVHRKLELPLCLLKGAKNLLLHVHSLKTGFLKDSLDCSLNFPTLKWLSLRPSMKAIL